MFIEKLTDEQIQRFLEEKYPNYKVSFSRDPISIRAMITNTHAIQNDYSWYECYFDFYSTVQDGPWVRYLYRVFGEEYKKAYLENCAKIFKG